MQKETAKLFRVLVLGGLSLAIPACSGDDSTSGGDGGTADAAKDQSSQPSDAASKPDEGTLMCKTCPSCQGSGVCGW